jgi:hypothetical protein
LKDWHREAIKLYAQGFPIRAVAMLTKRSQSTVRWVVLAKVKRQTRLRIQRNGRNAVETGDAR